MFNLIKFVYYKPLLFILAFLTFLFNSYGDIQLPRIFGNEMVIQRDTKAPVWGWADAGEKIIVTGSWGEKVETVANEKGFWSLKIATPPAGGPFTITVEGKNKIELKNVLSGEVWVCSGQSNMQWSVSRSKNPEEEIKAANYPEIRLFQVKLVPSTTPLYDTDGTWKKCSPESIPGFSATGYYFGRKLYKDLKIPIGLIQSAWGGTCIETWIPKEKQLDDPVVKKIIDTFDSRIANHNEKASKERYEKALKEFPEKLKEWKEEGSKGRKPRKPRPPRNPGKNQNIPGNLYNGMITPIVPFAIQGAIWYQGESNAGRATNYEKSLKQMITCWREVWGQGDFPFYFVQLPNFKAPWKNPIENQTWPILREAFMNTAKTLTNTGMAITMDIGEAKNIHPKNKQDVGDRLGRLALRDTYGKTDNVWTGPVYIDCRFEAEKAIIIFLTGDSPLAVRDNAKLFGFALTDDKGKTVRANAVIQEEDTVVVSSPEIKKAVCVHYAWADNPEGSNLINKAGLPASPFRHGEIPKPKPSK